jgi:hypothetical protein
MKLSSKVILGIAMATFLSLGVLALSARSKPQVQEAPSDGDPIILKGGSLTLQCPKGEICMIFNPTTMKFEHKDKLKKIAKIVVKDESGYVLFSATSVSFPNGKPSVEITYK